MPLAELPSDVTVPVKTTICPPSFMFIVRLVPESVPVPDPDVAQGLPLKMNCAETLLPFWVNVPLPVETTP